MTKLENGKMKLDENHYFVKKFKSNTTTIARVQIYDIDEWSRFNLWNTKKPLYMIEQDGMLVVCDLKLMQNIARTFDMLIERSTHK